jgi:hypothetical protein
LVLYIQFDLATAIKTGCGPLIISFEQSMTSHEIAFAQQQNANNKLWTILRHNIHENYFHLKCKVVFDKPPEQPKKKTFNSFPFDYDEEFGALLCVHSANPCFYRPDFKNAMILHIYIYRERERERREVSQPVNNRKIESCLLPPTSSLYKVQNIRLLHDDGICHIYQFNMKTKLLVIVEDAQQEIHR